MRSPNITFFRLKRTLLQGHMLDSHTLDIGEEADGNSSHQTPNDF